MQGQGQLNNEDRNRITFLSDSKATVKKPYASTTYPDAAAELQPVRTVAAELL